MLLTILTLGFVYSSTSQATTWECVKPETDKVFATIIENQPAQGQAEIEFPGSDTQILEFSKSVQDLGCYIHSHIQVWGPYYSIDIWIKDGAKNTRCAMVPEIASQFSAEMQANQVLSCTKIKF